MHSDISTLDSEFFPRYDTSFYLNAQVLAKPIRDNPVEATQRFYDRFRADARQFSVKFSSIQDEHAARWFATKLKYVAASFNEVKQMLASSDVNTSEALVDLSYIHATLATLDTLAERYV
jgi:hypothetical protein